MLVITRNKLVLGFVSLFVGTSFLVTQACGSASDITNTIDLISTAADGAVVLFEATGMLPAPIGTEIVNYLSAVTTATGETITELATDDTNAVKAGDIAGYWVAAVLPEIPGLTSVEQAAITGVEKLITQLLSEVKSLNVAPNALKSHVSKPNVKQVKLLADAKLHQLDAVTQLKVLRQKYGLK